MADRVKPQTLPDSQSLQSHQLLKRVLKVGALILAVPVAIIALVVIGAFVYTPLQKPQFVNQGLALQNPLRLPEVLQPQLANGEKVFNLTAQAGETQFLPGEATKTMGFNGSYLGPTIRAAKGDTVRINVTNNLPDATTAHWHGMELPAAMDGNPHQRINPGETWQPHWTVTNQAASLWYHTHMMGRTGEQSYRGLAGFFLIDDANSTSLDLPKDYGVNDIPLAIQDRQFDEHNQLVYRAHETDILGHTGMIGDKILVNGTYGPYVKVPAGQVRLRLLNASNARQYDFGFPDGRTFYQVASDGGLLEAPVARTRVMLAPGERAEIVVDLSKDTQPLTLMSYAVHENNRVLRFVRTLLQAGRDENQQFKILELRPQSTAAAAQPLPQKLNTITTLSATQAVKTRQFILDPGSESINNRKMDHTRVDQIVHSGDVEIWNVSNRSGVYHPFHIHGVQFQILDRGGKAPESFERGWKDTVSVANGESVRLIMRFTSLSDPNQPYMFHCHILEHEDMGMMGQFVVVDKSVSDKDVVVRTKLTETMAMPAHQH